MTKEEDSLRMRPSPGRRLGESPGEKNLRYAHNANTEADLAQSRARGARRSVRLNQLAAQNARSRGDTEAVNLYFAMADAAQDISDAQEDYAQAARAVARYYGGS